jgi:hypothetical protein
MPLEVPYPFVHCYAGDAMADFDETLRFPTRLQPADIYARLAKIHDSASEQGFADIAAALQDIASKTPTEIGKSVIRALGLIGGKPEQQSLAKQLQIVAVNLKNLK